MKQMTTNDMFAALVRDLSILSTEAYRGLYTELSRRVCAEQNDSANKMTPEAMHAAIMHARNQQQQPKTTK